MIGCNCVRTLRGSVQVHLSLILNSGSLSRAAVLAEVGDGIYMLMDRALTLLVALMLLQLFLLLLLARMASLVSKVQPASRVSKVRPASRVSR